MKYKQTSFLDREKPRRTPPAVAHKRTMSDVVAIKRVNADTWAAVLERLGRSNPEYLDCFSMTEPPIVTDTGQWLIKPHRPMTQFEIEIMSRSIQFVTWNEKPPIIAPYQESSNA